MTDTAKIRAKGLNATGITEDIVTRLADANGGHLVAVIELKVDEIHNKVDGDRRVDLVITQCEPAPDQNTVDHLRNLQRSFYYERKLHSEDEQLQIETREDLEPTVEQVLAAGKEFERTQDEPLPDPTDNDEPEHEDPAEAEGEEGEPARPSGTVADPFAPQPA